MTNDSAARKRVKALIFLLLRDELPFGTLVKLIGDLREDDFSYEQCSLEFEAVADLLTHRLLDGKTSDVDRSVTNE